VDGKLIDVSGVGLVTSPPVLPLMRRGGRFLKEGLTPLLNTQALLTRSKESQREAKPPDLFIGRFRGTKSLAHYLPFSLIKVKGDKGG